MSINMEPLDFQEEGIQHIVDILTIRDAALDASGTGYGKTYTSLFVSKKLGLRPAIVCPKSAIYGWQEVLEKFQIDPLFVTNYEQVKLSQFTYGYWKRKNVTYKWDLPLGTLLIFDECHRLKNMKSQVSKIATAIVMDRVKTLFLSATAVTSPLDMFTLGFCLGLFEDRSEYYLWVRKHGVVKGKWGFEFNRDNPEYMLKIHHAIFPKFGYRRRVKDISGFPDCQVQTLLVDGQETAEVKRYLGILKAMREFNEPLPVTEILRARQLSEMLKVRAMVEVADDLLDENLSVCFFVCFKESFKTIQEHFEKKAVSCSLVYGGQTDRDEHLNRFQNNENHVIICQIQAGGESINLHDLYGRQRVSLISPSYNPIEFVQVLGRTHRTGSKSPAIQKVFFCKGTVEEKVKRAIDVKVNNISLLNDGDMTPYEK